MMTTLLILKLTFLLRKSIKKYSFIQEKKKYCSIPNFLTDMQSTLYTFEWGHLGTAHTTYYTCWTRWLAAVGRTTE